MLSIPECPLLVGICKIAAMLGGGEGLAHSVQSMSISRESQRSGRNVHYLAMRGEAVKGRCLM